MSNRVKSVYNGILKCSNKKMNKKYKTIHQLLYYTPRSYFTLFIFVQLKNNQNIDQSAYNALKKQFLKNGATYADWYNHDNLILWSANKINKKQAIIISRLWIEYCQTNIKI